ncbi:MAG TPA: alpha-2-macroglobulin family protein, partial [Micavibrio sp.]
FGALDGEYVLPKSAAVGWYRFALTVNTDLEDGQVYELSPLRVLVSDFTVAPFRVSAEMNGDAFKAGDVVKLHAEAKMHAGGAYTDAQVRVTGLIKSRAYESKHPLAQGFRFDSFEDGQEEARIFEKTAPLNDKGEWDQDLPLPAAQISYGVLEVEAAVQDDRGKTIAGSSRADYRGVDRMVGLRSPQWTYDVKKPVSIPALVLDEKDTPVAGTAIHVKIEKEFINSARVKGAGNAYLSDITVEWKDAGSCQLISAAAPMDCTFTPESAGSYRLMATIQDTKGVGHKTTQYIWVTGDDYVQWGNETDSQLKITPEKATYQIGDTARYMIQNPFPGARALVTIERYGVMDSFVTTLTGSTPVIEFPVKPDYMPGYYLSVIVQSPRVEAPPAAEGQVDLGKPTFRMGYVTVPVKDPVKQMDVEIKVAQEVYRPRDKVKVDLYAAPRLATAAQEPIEYTVAVVDEAVFDLIQGGLKAYDPYEGFYNLDTLDLRNYSLMMRLIGRQKFEKKGANPGGDGGMDIDMRTLFKYVGYWNPGLKANADGRASFEFEAPDNLTGWRVMVIAATPQDRLGLGEGHFKVNRPTELRPVMPNQVREGDAFTAGFSVMNRTDKTRTIAVSIDVAGDIVADDPLQKTEEITLEPYKRGTIHMPIKAAILPVSRDVPQGQINFKVRAADALDSDATIYDLPVYKSRQTDVAAQYGSITDDPVEQSLAVPENIYSDSSQMDVVLSPSVLANLGGAFRYMRDYSYTCWEQSLTRAVMASQFQQLRDYLPEDVVWEDSDKIPQDMLNRAVDFQAPNGGMAYFKPQDAYVDPYLSAYTALAFGWLDKAGYTVPADVSTKLYDYLQNFLKQNVQPDFYQPGMSATVRAVALAALVEAGKAGRDDVQRFAPHVKDMSLFGKALFLKAATQTGGLEAETQTTLNAILAQGHETAGKMSFKEELDSGYSRILATALRDNCAVLDAFMDFAPDAQAAKIIADAPMKMARYVSQSRGSRDHWENTQENMFCMNALLKYARRYESEKVAATIVAQLNDHPLGQRAFTSVQQEQQRFTVTLTDEEVGKKSVLKMTKEGSGRIYYATRLQYAVKDAPGPVNAGMDLQRLYSVKRDNQWVALAQNDPIKRGDLVKVDLYLKIPAARNFVVVNDPLPGGLETVNRDLATASTLDADERGDDSAAGWQSYDAGRWSFYHRELRHDAVRFYSDWLEAGNYHLSYVAQAVADGNFNAPAAKAEEMYDADIYGRSTAGALTVRTGAP